MYVETLRIELVFLRQLIWGVTCLGLLEKWTCFPIYLFRNIRNVCWNHQNRACFSETIDLRGHMPWFTWKWMFSHPSPEQPHKCVLKPSEQGSFFLDNWFEGSHASVYWKNASFSHQSPLKHHKCVLKPSTQGLFFWDNRFEGSHA